MRERNGGSEIKSDCRLLGTYRCCDLDVAGGFDGQNSPLHPTNGLRPLAGERGCVAFDTQNWPT